MAEFKNRSGVPQQVYLLSAHSKAIARRLDGSELRVWDQDAPKVVIDPEQIIEVEDPADVALLRRLTRERVVRV
jgi:hypothetical protein